MDISGQTFRITHQGTTSDMPREKLRALIGTADFESGAWTRPDKAAVVTQGLFQIPNEQFDALRRLCADLFEEARDRTPAKK